IPGPRTGWETFVPGRQGIRAVRDFNPACRSAISFGTTTTAYLNAQPHAVPFLGVVSRRQQRGELTKRCRRRRPRSWFLGGSCLSARPPLLSYSLAGSGSCLVAVVWFPRSSIRMFVIEDEIHAEHHGQFNSFDEAL